MAKVARMGRCVGGTGLRILLGHPCDWPQILGPDRNGRAADEPDLQAWGAAGPRCSGPASWERATPAPPSSVLASSCFIAWRSERLEALDAASGKSLWQADFPATYAGGINPDRGPRCVPPIHEQRVYAYGAAGDCTACGSRWPTALVAANPGGILRLEGYFGAGSSPLVADGKLLVNVGGRDSGLVAFQLQDGATAWQATDEGASYSSPIATHVAGEPCVIFVTRLNAVGIAPRDGTIRFRLAFGAGGQPSTRPRRSFSTSTCSSQPATASVPNCCGWEQRDPRRCGPTTRRCPASTRPASTTEAFSTECTAAKMWATSNCAVLKPSPAPFACACTDFRPGHLTLVGSQLLVLTSEGRLYLGPLRRKVFDRRLRRLSHRE